MQELVDELSVVKGMATQEVQGGLIRGHWELADKLSFRPKFTGEV